MKQYNEVNIEIILLHAEDVIAESGGIDCKDEELGWGD